MSYRTPSAHAKLWGYTNNDLWGSYHVQFHGTVNFPPDTLLAAFNGPFALNGRIVSDGQGKLKKQIVASVNGQIQRGTYDAVYDVKPDGTFTESFAFPVPQLGALVLSFDGVLTEDGKRAHLILSGIAGAPLPPNYVGMGIVGEMERQ